MAKKPKRLNLSPEDRVQGMQPREKRDLFAGCNEAGKQWFHPDAHVFMKHFCRFCKNADCIRAKGAVSPWHTRMAEQVDYLLNDPQFSEMKDPAHLQLAQQAFDDIGSKMMRLEIARERQDWEIPEGPTDGYDKVAAPDTTDQFDDAVKELAKARGKEEPNLQRPEGTDGPAHFQEEAEESPYEYDTQFPSEDGKNSYHVVLHKDGRWTCECKGFGRWRHCKHLTEVRTWYEEQLRQNADDDDDDGGDSGPSSPTGPATATAPPPPPPEEPPPQAAQPDPRVPPEQGPYNTPMPQGGVMVDGGQAPEDEMQRRPRSREKDPWAIPKDKVVEPGATVTVKRGKKK